MSKAAANIVLAWHSGMLLGVGAATGNIALIVGGAALTVMSLYYYHRFVKPKEQ